MGRKILIVGGVAGGASAAARLRRHSEEDQIIMFEKGPHVSFSNCSLPYHLSGVIKEADDMVLMNPQMFLKQYNIDSRVNHEVIAIDRENKKVTVKNVLTKENYTETYDKLILSPGAYPIVPNISGIDHVNVFTIRNVVDIDKLNKFLRQLDTKDVAVIGGGYVGVEAAENLRKAGYNVSLIEATNQILRPFDYDMIFIIPIPPTKSDMPAIQTNTLCNMPIVELISSNISCMPAHNGSGAREINLWRVRGDEFAVAVAG